MNNETLNANPRTFFPDIFPKEKVELVLQLTSSKKSSYIMDPESIGLSDSPERLDKTAAIEFPSLRVIRRTSRVVIEDAQGFKQYRNIRYIKGCPTIDREWQDKNGWKPNPTADAIIVRNGSFKIWSEPDRQLFEYLKICEYNESFEFRPEDPYETIFREINAADEAENTEDLLDLKFQANQKLNSFKTRSTLGGFTYNEDALKFLCSIFKVPAFESGFKSEAWVALAAHADADPKKFLNSIANARSIYESEVLQAMSHGVIGLTQENAYFTETNKVIMTFESGMSDDVNLQSLVDFMSNPNNKNFYDTLKVELRTKLNSATAVIK